MKLYTNILLSLSGIVVAVALSACGPSGEKKSESGSSSSSASSSGSAATASSNDPAAPPPGIPDSDLKEEKPEYPKPMFIGTPVPTGNIKNLETPDPEAVKKRLTFKIPKDATNVALHKKVTSSDPLPIIGTLDLVTDGDTDGSDGSYVELSPGKQWVQIDLGADYKIWKLLVWHFHKQTAVYFDVVVQISDDPEFKKDVTTVFNNDIDDELKLGAGKDKDYVETNHGRLIDGKGTKGRYVRLWSKGNSANEMNHYIEVSVYGSPAK